jgi:hypothetical protein
MKPDVRALKCLCQLQEPGFEPLLEWLRAERQRNMETLVSSNDDTAMHLHQLQGRARALGELLILVDGARDYLTKLEK